MLNTSNKKYLQVLNRHLKKLLIITFLLTVVLSCNKESDIIFALQISESSLQKLNKGILTISRSQIREFNMFYTAMIGVLNDPDYLHYSHIGLYKITPEYEDFENYCQSQSKKIYLLLIDKVIKDFNSLACEALLNFAGSEYGYTLQFLKENNITEADVKDAYIVLIEKLLLESDLFVND